jgi:uncharacterized protein (TIGR00255 family)
MTGFGAGTATVGAERISVEARSVNHKFCEVKARLPRELAALETALVRQVKDRLARGAVDVAVHRARAVGGAVVPKVDLDLAREYAAAYRALGQTLAISEPLSLRALFEAEGVVRLEEASVDLEAAGQALAQALDEALGKLATMRTQEGLALAADLGQRVERVAQLAAEVRRLAPATLEGYRDRLAARVAQLSKGQPVSEERLAQEIALAAARMDVEEELTRLDSHLAQLRPMLAQEEAVGRRMDFLIQEVHREINTLGSKAEGPAIAALVVELKAEAERFREQVQNVE